MEAGVGWWLRSAPIDCGAVNPASGLPCDARMAASNCAISLVQGPACALAAVRTSTAERRAAVIPGLDIGSTRYHDPIRLNRIMISFLYLSMIFSENRFPLCANAALRVRIMLH